MRPGKSAIWRINLLVTLFFALVGAACLALLLRQERQARLPPHSSAE